MAKNIVISFTGHRPEQLGGFNFHHPINLAIASKIHKRLLYYLEQEKSVHAISGMDLGADQIFALTVLKLKKQGYSIALEAAIPCANQPDGWPKESKKIWQDILDQTDTITNLSTEDYSPQLIHKRNMYLVNRCDEIIAVFNGKRGGTGNTIRYAKKRNRPIFLIDPRSLVIPVQGDLLTSDCDILMHQTNCL
ncbi:SLOG family protein [Gracilibacillus sp. Marseille-QA3620]